jgi:hypothetical protein
MFTFHHSLPNVDIDGLKVRMVNARPPVTKYSALVLNIEEAPDGYSGSIEFAGDVFDEDTVQQIAMDFEMLCRTACDDLGVTLQRMQKIALSGREKSEQARIGELRARRKENLAELIRASTAVPMPI